MEVNGVYCNSRQVGQAAPLTLQKLICETEPEKMEIQPLLLLGPWQLAIIKREKTMEVKIKPMYSGPTV